METFILKEIKKTSELIESLLFKYSSEFFKDYKDLHFEIVYNLKEKGLRIRPFLFRIGYESGGGNFKDILPIGAAIEFMQIATLVMDDILDESEIRNGRDSVYKKWGIKNSILVGELLKSTSTIILLQSIHKNKKFKNTYDVLNLFENIYKNINIGQYLDLSYENKKIITEAEYMNMIKNTTALFIQSSIKLGAMLSGASKEIQNSLSAYGLSLGYAYQIRDDVIDIIGEEKYVGKPIGNDIKRRKKRLPFIHAFSNASKSINERLNTLYKKNKMTDGEVKEIIELLNKCGSVEYSISKVKYFCKKATNNIKAFKNRKVKILLSELSELVSSF